MENVENIGSTAWYKLITVEPTMFLYMMAFMLTTVIEQEFFVQKACRVNHNFTAEICDNIKREDFKSYYEIVQATVSDFLQWNSIAGHIVPIVLALFLGAWSDKRGRKLPLLMGLVGKLIYSLMIVVNAKMSFWPVEYIIYTATIPSALTGADVAIFASCFAYISDVSTVKNRTIRVTILDVCYLSTMPIGVGLGAVLFKAVSKSYAIMFAVNCSLLLFSIIYTWIFLKWQTNSQQSSFRELGCFGLVSDFFDKQHVFDSLKVLTKKREERRRLFLAIFLLAMALYVFQRDEKPYVYLYATAKFNWDVTQYSYFRTFQSSAYVITMLTFIPLMSKLLKFKDTTICLIGSLAHAIARIIYILANVGWVFYVGSLVCSFGPIVGPLLRSMTSKIVPITERGKVFALLSVCDNAVPFFSGVLYTQVHKATIGKAPGVFYLTFASQIGVFLIIMIVHAVLGSKTLAITENDADKQLMQRQSEND